MELILFLSPFLAQWIEAAYHAPMIDPPESAAFSPGAYFSTAKPPQIQPTGKTAKPKLRFYKPKCPASAHWL